MHFFHHFVGLLLILPRVIFCESNIQSVWNFQIGRKILTSFEYKGREVAIWLDKETENQPVAFRQFYITPMAELIPTSARCDHNILTDTYQVSYSIQIWNRHLDDAAVATLKKLELNVRSDQIHPLPFYQVGT